MNTVDIKTLLADAETAGCNVVECFAIEAVENAVAVHGIEAQWAKTDAFLYSWLGTVEDKLTSSDCPAEAKEWFKARGVEG